MAKNTKNNAGTLLNSYYNPLNAGTVDALINPAFTSSTGKELSNKLGMIYDYSDILKIFEDAAKSGNAVTKEMYDMATQKFNSGLATQSAAYLDAMRKANASSANTGASKGVAAANELSALLGMTQQGADGALELAQQGLLLGDKMGADLTAAQKETLTNFNQIGTTLGELLNNAEAVDAQKMAVIAQLMANGFAFDENGALIPPAGGGAAGGGGGGGGGYSRGTGTGTGAGEGAGLTVDEAGNVIPGDQFGRYTIGVTDKATAVKDPYVGQPVFKNYVTALDQIDRYGKASPALLAQIEADRANNPKAFAKMVESVDKFAQQVANETSLQDGATGAFAVVPEANRAPDKARGDSAYYNQLPAGIAGPLNLKPGKALDAVAYKFTGDGLFANAAQKQAPTGLIPAGAYTGNDIRDRAVTDRILAANRDKLMAGAKPNEGVFEQYMNKLSGTPLNTMQPDGSVQVNNLEALLIGVTDEDEKERIRKAFKDGGYVAPNDKVNEYKNMFLGNDPGKNTSTTRFDGSKISTSKKPATTFGALFNNAAAPATKAPGVQMPAAQNAYAPGLYNAPKAPAQKAPASTYAQSVFTAPTSKPSTGKSSGGSLGANSSSSYFGGTPTKPATNNKPTYPTTPTYGQLLSGAGGTLKQQNSVTQAIQDVFKTKSKTPQKTGNAKVDKNQGFR